MNHSDSQEDVKNSRPRLDLLSLVDAYWRKILTVAVSLTALVALVGFIYLNWGQPTLRTVVLEFRPTFDGAADGHYPNDLPFGTSDITAASIMDHVFDTNKIEEHCGRDSFKSAFFVEQESAEYSLLAGEFAARLADPRLTAVDRDRVFQEYRARRTALPVQYQLVFVVPRACESLPPALVSKLMNEVLTTWAEESESRRGVLKLQVQMLTANVLDIGLVQEGALMIRADLIRTGLRRLLNNVQVVEERPGANLVRLGENSLTFAEIKTKFEDLIQARLEPLIVLAGRGLGSESYSWINEALASALQEQEIAEGKADEFLKGLREYSGTAQLKPSSSQPLPSTSSDLQTLTPQIDRTFIDRILEMSEANTEFRQELTRGIVEAGVAAVQSRAKVGYYRNLIESLRGPQRGGLLPEEVNRRLEAIVQDGKRLATQFNELYDQWSLVALRPGAAMYQTMGPAQVDVSRSFSFTSLLLLVLGVFLLTVLIASVAFLVFEQFRQLHARRG